MNISEFLSLLFSLVAIVISIVVYLANKKATSAITELTMREGIKTTTEKMSEFVTIMTPLSVKKNRSEEEEQILEIYKTQYNLTIENNLNAYEKAATIYIDGKVDRNRFKKDYQIEIRNLVENEKLKQYFDPISSRYKAILKVYHDWENHEK